MSEDVKSMIRITRVKAVSEFALCLRWASGTKELNVDLREPVFRLKGLRPLRDPAVFARAVVGEGGNSLVWPGEIDMGADRLWELSLEQNGRADSVEFIHWRWKHGLSLNEAARALDVSRRAIAYYVSGDAPVPRTILLACKGWEVEQGKAKRAIA